MKTLYFLLIIIVIIVVLCKCYNIETFNNFFYPGMPFPWQIPTRNMPLYYDIRGDPNVVYRKMMFGEYVPFGYIFGPYVYDTQGNYVKHADEKYYVI